MLNRTNSCLNYVRIYTNYLYIKYPSFLYRIAKQDIEIETDFSRILRPQSHGAIRRRENKSRIQTNRNEVWFGFMQQNPATIVQQTFSCFASQRYWNEKLVGCC